MRKIFRTWFFCMLLFTNILILYSAEDNSYVRIKTYFPTESSIQYKNFSLSTAVHYSSPRDIVFHFTLNKGKGEPGYYPLGAFGENNTGLYENGTYYVYFKNYFSFNKIILGNYLPLFGQGLLFGDKYPLILSNPYYEVARFRDSISPSGSASKTSLLEGVALEYEKGDLTIRPFISWNRFDCSAGESDYYLYNDNDGDGEVNGIDDDGDFTGRREEFPDGYSCKSNIFSCIRGDPDYGEESDRGKRNNLREYIAGVNATYDYKRLKAGSTFTYTRFNRLIDPYYNFEVGEGDKTGNYFRGKDLFSSSVYFKIYSPVELFGEVVHTIHKNLSYYSEFYGGISSAVGFSGGARGKINDTGIVVWGTYLPAHLVNTHGVELPEGIQNHTSGLFGIYHLWNRAQLNSWMYLYKELHDTDYPGFEEEGISLNYRVKFPVHKDTVMKVRQDFDFIENYYNAPFVWTYKIISKASIIHPLSEQFTITIGAENRMGSSEDEKVKMGIGVSAEAFYNSDKYNTSFQVLYYITDDDRFAYLYPYERQLYKWRFLSTGLHGRGIMSTFTFSKEFSNNFTTGVKLKHTLDFRNDLKQKATIYGISEYIF